MTVGAVPRDRPETKKPFDMKKHSVLDHQVNSVTAVSTATTHGSLWLEVDRARLLHNVGVIKRLAGPGVKVLAVIKANAYGHGLETVASTLAPHVSMFGVSQLPEVLRLREHGIETPILILTPLAPADVCSAIQSQSTITVSSFEEAGHINAEAARLMRVANVHIKVDTGMGRLGISHLEATSVIEKMASLNHIRFQGLYTHFASADLPDRLFTRGQITRFTGICRALMEKGLAPKDVHLSNSSGVMLFKAAGGTMVRPGIMLYGILPTGLRRSLSRSELLPTLAWRTRILFIKVLLSGDSCGYGRSYVAKRREYIAWLPVGYGHGYPLSLSNKARVLIRGRRYRVAGKVSMDLTAVSLGGRRNAEVGDEVTLLGSDGAAEITVSEFAEWAGTIPYEILTRIHPSIPRRIAP